MESEIVFKNEKTLIIGWSKDEVGFGQLTIKRDKEDREWILDSECMGLDFILEVFRNLKTKFNT